MLDNQLEVVDALVLLILEGDLLTTREGDVGELHHELVGHCIGIEGFGVLTEMSGNYLAISSLQRDLRLLGAEEIGVETDSGDDLVSRREAVRDDLHFCVEGELREFPVHLAEGDMSLLHARMVDDREDVSVRRSRDHLDVP